MALLEKLIYNEYFRSLLILTVTFTVSYLFCWFMNSQMRKLVKKTESDFDDILLEIIKKPLRNFIVLIGFYVSLKNLSDLSPYSSWINLLFFLLLVINAAVIISRVLNVFVMSMLKVHKRFRRTPQLIGKIITATIYIIAFLIILAYFEIEITPLIATLGIGALAVGLALQNTLSNFFAGLHIISDRPIDIGDFIEIQGTITGYVEDIGWRSTRIRTLSNTIVIIPNSNLAESVIINDSMPEPEMAISVDCGVSYKSDLKKVEEVTIDAARKLQATIPGVVKDFDPLMRYKTFGDSNINFSVILRVEEPTMKRLVTHELIKELKARYDKEGIEISWPVRKVYMAK